MGFAPRLIRVKKDGEMVFVARDLSFDLLSSLCSPLWDFRRKKRFLQSNKINTSSVASSLSRDFSETRWELPLPRTVSSLALGDFRRVTKLWTLRGTQTDRIFFSERSTRPVWSYWIVWPGPFGRGLVGPGSYLGFLRHWIRPVGLLG